MEEKILHHIHFYRLIIMYMIIRYGFLSRWACILELSVSL